MQAVVLVGGEGTRLRPLTSTMPKPVVPLVDRPFMAYMLEWLRRHGVDDVVLSMGYLADAVRDVLGDGSAYGLRIRYVEEPDPRGTAGALKFAQGLLDERFFLLNGDVLTDLDLTAQLDRHVATGARGTLALVPVSDPSAYGLVRTGEDGAVRGFVEKPPAEEIDTNLISAGAYVLERSVLDLIEPDRKVSIEREVWPALVGDGLFAFAHEGAYWMDIGTPDRYLQGTADIVLGRVRTEAVRRLGDCDVAADAVVGPEVVLGDGVTIGPSAVLERCVVLAGASVGAACRLHDCVVGPGARVGARTEISGEAMLGEGVVVGEDCLLTRGVRVFPQVQIPDGGIRF